MAETAQHSSTQEAQEHLKGIVAWTLEKQTAKLPSDIFLLGALGSTGVSPYFEMMGDEEKSRFVSQWVSPFLLRAVLLFLFGIVFAFLNFVPDEKIVENKHADHAEFSGIQPAKAESVLFFGLYCQRFLPSISLRQLKVCSSEHRPIDELY